MSDDLTDRVEKLELAVLAIATQRFEEVGHPFRGNQYTAGHEEGVVLEYARAEKEKGGARAIRGADVERAILEARAARRSPPIDDVAAEVERTRREREDRMIENTDPAIARRISSMSGPQGEAARRNYISSGTDPSWYGG